MQVLDLPPFEAKLTQSATNQPLIWDGLRRKHVVLTPEEWVRQHVVHYLTDHLGYPRGLLALERGLRYNQRQKRTDLLALNHAGQPLLLLTNGLVHYCWRVDFATRTNQRLAEIPPFEVAVGMSSGQ